jgi:serine/threonine protein kinase
VRQFSDRTSVAGEMADPSSLIGQTISHYRIIEKLGGGGMGVAYRAEDTKLKRQVALKFPPQDSLADKSALERFEREAFHDIDQDSAVPSIAMELLKGSTLEKVLRKYINVSELHHELRRPKLGILEKKTG